MNRKDLERQAVESLTEPCMKGLLDAVFLARRNGVELSHQWFARPEAVDVQGFNVRASLEGLVREVAERHGHEAEYVRAPRQRWHHTEMKCGSVVLTTARVAAPGAMVEPADYRRGLAKTDQLEAFPDGHRPADGNYCYVILAHSPYLGFPEDMRKYRHLPGSVCLVWPAEDFQCYLHSINLMLRYPDTVRKRVPQDWDEESFQKYLETSRYLAGYEGSGTEG